MNHQSCSGYKFQIGHQNKRKTKTVSATKAQGLCQPLLITPFDYVYICYNNTISLQQVGELGATSCKIFVYSERPRCEMLAPFRQLGAQLCLHQGHFQNPVPIQQICQDNSMKNG